MDSRKSPVISKMAEPACSFCPPLRDNEWFNRPLISDGDTALAIPSVGSLVPGYLLAIPVAHVTAACKIPSEQKNNFTALVARAVLQLQEIYEVGVTIFEHGACGSMFERRSACVSHAHLHLVPGYYNLMIEAPGTGTTTYSTLENFLDVDQASPYLMLKDPDGPIVTFPDYGISQFFRRVIAQRLGSAERWDYAIFPFFENVKKTYADFDCKP